MQTLLIILLLGLGFILLRTRATRLDSAEDFDALIRDGRPVVVEFFANT